MQPRAFSASYAQTIFCNKNLTLQKILMKLQICFASCGHFLVYDKILFNSITCPWRMKYEVQCILFSLSQNDKSNKVTLHICYFMAWMFMISRGQPWGSTPGVKGWFQSDLSKKKILWRTDGRTNEWTYGWLK